MLAPQAPRPAELEVRIGIVGLALLVAFGGLALRLWELQVHRGVEFVGKSDRNRLRIQRLESPRGIIYGRSGAEEEVVLADNRPARDLMFALADCDIDPERVIARLEELVDVDAERLRLEIEQAESSGQPHRQILIQRDVPMSVSARIDEYAYALPGVFTLIRPVRRYVYGRAAGHVLGYLGEVNAQELQKEGEEYRMGDLIGRAGLERLYEDILHGSEGQMLVTRYATGVPQIRTDPYGRPRVESLVDNYGHDLRVERAILEPEKGKSLYITLDIGLQQRAEQLLEGSEGAISVINAETGAVLALASSPGSDPSIFVTENVGHEREDALRGKPNRMMHRAYQEVFAPGSVFKVLLATAALEEGIIDASTTHTCGGVFRIAPGERPWRCWKRSGHGTVDVVDALAFSCDVFFYKVGLEVGVDKIHEWSRRFGLGRRTGLDLPGEQPGLIPSRQWKEDLLRPSHRNEPWEYRWYPGDTVNLSIGQGAMTTTTLQNAVLMAAVVNGGHRVQPFLNRISALTISDKLVSERTLDLVRRGMRRCVEKGPPAPTGTGHEAYLEGLDIIGKTGSAQNVSLDKHEEYETEEDIPMHLRDHAWFVAGVLDRKPRIALCVLVEHGHHGSSAAAPLAGELIEYFYDRQDALEMKVAQRAEGDPQ